MQQLLKSRAFLVLRLAAGAIILAVLCSRLNMPRLLESARQSSPWLLGCATLVLGLKMVIAAWRWRLTCWAAARKVPLRHLLVWYMEATFFNFFIPSQGGDLVRAWRLAAADGDAVAAVSTVIAERVFGLVGMILLAGCGIMISPLARALPGIHESLLVTAGVTAALVMILFHPFLSKALINFFRRNLWNKTSNYLTRAAEIFAGLAKHPWAMVGILLCSLSMQLTAILATFLIGLAVSIPVAFPYYLLAVPIIWLVVMVPISINGIGTREVATITVFGAVGVAPESALLMSVLWSAQLLLFGLLGGGVHLLLTVTERRPHPGPSN